MEKFVKKLFEIEEDGDGGYLIHQDGEIYPFGFIPWEVLQLAIKNKKTLKNYGFEPLLKLGKKNERL